MMLCGACVTGGLLFSVSCHVRGERAGQVKDRAEPGRVSGAGGVLEVTGREPDDVAAGNRSRGLFARWYSVVFGPVPGSGFIPVRAVPLAAFIPSRGPGRGRGAWGGFASGGARPDTIGRLETGPGISRRHPDRLSSLFSCQSAGAQSARSPG
jgi:hypothetical protein